MSVREVCKDHAWSNDSFKYILLWPLLMCTSGIFELKAVGLIKLMKEDSSYALNFNFWCAYNIAYSKMLPSFTVWSVKKYLFMSDIIYALQSLYYKGQWVAVIIIGRDSGFNGSLCIHTCIFILRSAGIFSCDLNYVVCNSKIMCPHVVETGLGSTVE